MPSAESGDVDNCFHRDYLGFADHDHDPEAACYNKQQKSRIEDLQAACVTCIRESLLPALSTKKASILGSIKDWSIEVDALDPQTLLFHYPQAGTSELSYIKASVKIELGARSDHWPREAANACFENTADAFLMTEARVLRAAEALRLSAAECAKYFLFAWSIVSVVRRSSLLAPQCSAIHLRLLV